MNNSFNPLEWAAANSSEQSSTNQNGQIRTDLVNTPIPAAPVIGGELEKVRAVTEELLRLGANIAESYDDYYQLGFELADALGADGCDIYHQLCSQSTKYNKSDCEKKWLECLSKHDGRRSIASFYKKAQDAGVDISAISRKFPSEPSNPHLSTSPSSRNGFRDVSSSEDNYNNNVMDSPSGCGTIVINNQESREGMRESEGNCMEIDNSEEFQYTETFSNKLDIPTLPPLLRDAVMVQTEAEGRDKVMIASLTLFSGAMPNVFGIYDSKRVYPPIYALVDAPSGADKGVISDCRQLLIPIEYEIRRRYEHLLEEYQEEYAQWAAKDKKERAKQQEPKKPPFQSLFIPANSSATACYQALADNGEWGVIFETEADTLAQALKQDYGDYSDGLRKAFHHETISYNRRKDDEHVNVECPRLAALLTCTPGQIPLLISPQQVENGLGNRFLYYNLKSTHKWRNVFAQCEEPLTDRLRKIGERYLELYHDLWNRSDKKIQFVLSIEQQQQFNDYFSGLLLEQIGLHGNQLDAFVKRLGLSTFRLAMVLTVLRCNEQQPRFEPESQTIICSDEDFHTAMVIADCLINHTAHVYANLLPHEEQPVTSGGQKLSVQELALFRALATEFTTQDCQQAAASLNMAWKTAERYLGNFVSKYHIAERIRNGQYRKR